MVAASLEVMEAALNNRPARTDLVEVVRARARAEWVEWSTLVGLADAEEAEIRAGDSPGVMKLVELSAIPGDIGRSVHWSEGQVSYRVAQARRLRDHTPKVWDAFRSGSIDGAKAREVSAAVDKLERSASIERLDRQVVAYAESHTVAELRRWLKVFVARVEADLFNERAEKARDNRGVEVVHGGDGMSQLFADLASMDAAAINYRLDKEARALGADDPRTMDQRRADLLAGWCLTNETGQAAVNANIAVTLTGSTLAGTDHYPAVSGDGTWIVPTQWILGLAKNTANNLFWHRMVLDPVTDNVLAHEYRGRFAPDILAKALEFRDGLCQAKGCCKPASLCDIDHRIPFDDDGPTTGWNLGPYCRKHHIQKGFGLIDVGPTTTSPPGRTRNTPLHPVGMPEPMLELKFRSFLNVA